jgi:hypothetical protein
MSPGDPANRAFSASHFILAGATFAVISAAMVAFWKFRIVDTAANPALLTRTIDLYTEHLPTVRFGFGVLASGSIPLWNPYQLCGIPFLAVPHTGLLYPGNWPYLWMDAAAATELVYVLHLIFAAASLWGLARIFGLGRAGSAAGVVAYVWSGFLVANVHQSAILSGLAWLPATILAIECTLRGKRWGPPAIALAVALQIFNGATEVLVYTLYTGALFVLVRSVRVLVVETTTVLLLRVASVLGGIVVGAALSMVQLLPSLELVLHGARASQALALKEQLGPYGPIPLSTLLLTLLQQPSGVVGAGLLLLGVSLPRQRSLWTFGLAASILSILLISGGPIYEQYARTPLAALFRYPWKFQQILSFALALLVATGVHALASRCGDGRSALWANRWWLANAAGVAVILAALVGLGMSTEYALPVAAAVALFATIRWKSGRLAIVWVFVIAFGAALFQGASNDRIRPAGRPGLYESNETLFAWLSSRTANSRVYLSPRLRLFPGVTLKQGMLQRVPTVGDYEPLANLRQAEYFDAAAGEELARKLVINDRPNNDRARTAFAGYSLLGEGSRWALMDMASTRFFVTASGDEAARALELRARDGPRSGVRRVEPPGTTLVDGRGRSIHVYEASGYLPRAYFVSQAIVASRPEEALGRILSPDFDPHRTVVLEASGASIELAAANGARLRPASIRESSRERVELAIETEEPGFLVLTDTWFPGWRATVQGEPAPIHHANYLFRAVPVAAGVSSVVFEYRPQSLRIGALVSGVTAGAMAIGALVGLRRHARA